MTAMKYVKLSRSILTSALWTGPDSTRIAWICLLAMADENGEVKSSIPGLANIARIGIQECREAIDNFTFPDPFDLSSENEGRRIEEIEGGWLLLSYAKHNSLTPIEQRREKAAERGRRHYAKKKLARNSVQ